MSLPNGHHYDDEEEAIDLQAELDEGFADIERKCVMIPSQCALLSCLFG